VLVLRVPVDRGRLSGPLERQWVRVRGGVALGQIVVGESPAVEAGGVLHTILAADGTEAGDQRSSQLSLLREGRRVAVQRGEGRLLGVELPAGVMFHLLGGEREFDDPSAPQFLPAGPPFASSAEVM